MAGRILIVDDDPLIRREIRSVLVTDGQFASFHEAEDGLSALKLLLDHPVDLVVCDLVMPGYDGLKFLSLKASRKELESVPVIILTAEDDAERKAELLARGASDYVTKPFHEKELLARVRIHHKLKVLQDELREKNELLEQLSVTDPLTGLFNRRHLMSKLEKELARMDRYRHPLSVVMIDLDHFKQVNDQYGHAMGDEVLRNVGRLLREEVRTTDVAARYGGEEMTLLLAHTDLAGAQTMAENLRQKIEKFEHKAFGAALKRTASFGVAACLPGEDLPSALGLLQSADAALYRAKKNGRNRVEIAGESEPAGGLEQSG